MAPVPVASLGGSLHGRGAGVRCNVAVLVGGLVHIQRLPVDLQRHAAAVEGCDGGRGQWHIWAEGQEQTVSVGQPRPHPASAPALADTHGASVPSPSPEGHGFLSFQNITTPAGDVPQASTSRLQSGSGRTPPTPFLHPRTTQLAKQIRQVSSWPQ